MVGGIRVYNKFDGVDEEYFATIKMTPATYGYIHTNSIVAKDNATECYKITRDIQYATFGFLKDRFYAGLLSIYANIFDEMKYKSYDENALTNLFALAFETDNDIPNKTISFDVVFIECDSEDNLRDNEDLKKYVESYKSGRMDHYAIERQHSAILNYGKLFKGAVKDLDLLSRVYHMKAFKIQEDGMSRVNLPSGIYYKDDTKDVQDFVKQVLNDGSEYHRYIIGLSLERNKDE